MHNLMEGSTPESGRRTNLTAMAPTRGLTVGVRWWMERWHMAWTGHHKVCRWKRVLRRTIPRWQASQPWHPHDGRGGVHQRGEKANLFYIRSSSASRTSMWITNFIMVPILQKWFVWRPFIICDKIFLNGTIFFVLDADQTYLFEWNHIFYIEHRFPRRTFNRLIKLIMPTAFPLSRSPYISLSRFYIPFIVRSKQEWK